MKPRISLLCVFLFVIIYPDVLFSQHKEDNSNYQLIWSDEFNYLGAPDPNKWEYETGFVRNAEPQWYQAENVLCDGNYLIITANEGRVENPVYDWKSKSPRYNRKYAKYSSGSVTTKNTFNFKYGKVEIRAKLPFQKGMWPAFWMQGIIRQNGGGWPESGEVDIFEYFRGNLHSNIAWKGPGKNVRWNIKKHLIANFSEEWQNEFHTYTMYWDENHITTYVDNTLLNRIDISKTVNHGTSVNPFHANFYFILNLALGQGNESIPKESLPASFVIDYIRVYQIKT